MEEISDFAKKIMLLFEKPFYVDQHKISITVSIGISYTAYCHGKKCEVCTGKCKDALEMLLKKADAALNQLKSNGKNNFIIFDPFMNEEIQRKALLQQELKFAIKNGELLLYYQPKYNLEKKNYDGFEALLRWKHPIKGFISPVEFIQVAEESNLIIEIGSWVLEKACLFIKEFNSKCQKEYSIAINISAIQLLSDGFEEDVYTVLEKTGLEPKYLELEITESIFVNSLEIACEKLNYFREKNISIALDDFGTGYSSLTYLKSLPFTTLKLDKSFVDDIVINEVSLKIVDNVIQIGKNTGLKIIIEGVETLEQFQILSPLQCDYIQGYYFSKPLPEEEVFKIVGEI